MSEEESEARGESNQLLADQHFNDHMKTIGCIVDRQLGNGEEKIKKHDPKTVQTSNEYASTIMKEINFIFRSVKTVYYKKFPEL